jgi:NAD(P)-dependent dehydrogenase (short-subunit alcohol dehydrogenase family)
MKGTAILITGGTSGLGLETARIYSERGATVFVTGRDPGRLKSIKGDIRFVFTDFSDIKSTSNTIRNLFRENKISVLINNAGILSPPEKMVTADGFEYTYQVNFLVHLLISELFLNYSAPDSKVTVASVISPVYTLAARKKLLMPEEKYHPFTEYALSKLNLARLSSIIADRHSNKLVRFVSYNPGTFGSSIHRMQRGFFKRLYIIAAVIMTNPARVAEGLVNVLDNQDIIDKAIYNKRGKMKIFREPVPEKIELFRQESLSHILPFLSE